MSTDSKALSVFAADITEFPIDLSGYPLVTQTLMPGCSDIKGWTVRYFMRQCKSPIPTKEDWALVAEDVKEYPGKIVGVLSPPCYMESTYYENEEDSPTISDFLSGNYVNKGTKGSIAIVYLAMEDK